MAREAEVLRAVASGRNDVVYLAPATEPYEALPLGNGRLGVMMRNQGGITWLFNHGSFFANAAQDNDLLSSGEVTLALPEGDYSGRFCRLRQERPTIEGVAQIFKNWKIVFAKG